MANEYVKVEDRVRVTGLRRRREISVLTQGDGSHECDWSAVIWPNRCGHEGDMMAADAVLAGLKAACKDMRERCAEEARVRIRTLLWEFFRDRGLINNEDAVWGIVGQEAECIAAGIRELEL